MTMQTLLVLFVTFHISAWAGVRKIQTIQSATKQGILSQVASVGALLSVFTLPSIAKAVETENKSYISERVLSTDADVLSLGVRYPDVYYPSWFLGDWQSLSTFKNIYLPLGFAAIGGKEVFDRALKDLNTDLRYISRFIHRDGGIISDREYNVQQIASASMGSNTSFILNPNADNSDLAQVMNILLSPAALVKNKGIRYKVTLATLSRDVDNGSERDFEVMERTRQIIQPVSYGVDNLGPPSVKDIETITCYSLERGQGKSQGAERIVAKQRTASYLSVLDPRYLMMQREVGEVDKKAVEVRYYELVMNKI